MASFGLLARLSRHRSPDTLVDNEEDMTTFQTHPTFANDNSVALVESFLRYQQPSSQAHDAQYYGACYLAGGLSSSIRWVLSPIELVKTRLQTAPLNMTSTAGGGGAPSASGLYAAQSSAMSSLRPSCAAMCANVAATAGQGTNTGSSSGMMSTMSYIYNNEGGVRGLFRGLGPTAAAYWFQTSTKYGLYEVLKDQLVAHQPNESKQPSGWTYIVAAATAEAVADILMCPWEMIKVKLQTSSLAVTPSSHASGAATGCFGSPRSTATVFPSRFGPALVEMMRHRRHYNFPFGSLGPLWGRQIPGTIVNFYTFERTVQFIYNCLGNDKDDYTVLQQLGVTLCAGNVAGVCCALVSHPADSLISLKALPMYAGQSVRHIVQSVGWYRLATRGLAPRILVTGQIISMQWLLYDSFKSILGYGTSGGSSH